VDREGPAVSCEQAWLDTEAFVEFGAAGREAAANEI
jgi:hypothetical protein